MAEEITYIPYGLDEISQLDLMTSLANGIDNYLGSKRWARKDKYRLAWLNAYLDIITKGLIGASNDTGIWKISYNGDEDFDSKTGIEKEMYLDAAYYIQLLMSRMTPRKKIEEKKPLTSFNFYEDFNNHLLKGYGNSREIFADPEQGWDSLDVRGENGLRKTDNRKAAMIKALQEYSDNLLEDKYNFEGTQFADLKDAKAKILAAIDALKTNEESDDLPAFSALGLKYRSYFSNGGNDYSEHINPETNTPYTWSDWNKAEEERLKKEAKVNVEKAKAAKQAAYNNTLFFNRVTNSKMFGQNALALKDKYKDHNTLFAALQEYAQKDIRTLSPQEQSEVQGAYRYLAKDPVDDKVLNQLRASSSGLYKNAAPNRFRKIKGIDNLVWDSAANQVIQINTRLQQLVALNLPLDLFANIKTKEDIQNTPISQEGWNSADTADVVSMIGDLVSLGGFWANVGGTATSLTSDLYADIAREKDLGDILKGVGVNLGWGLAGMLPGAKSTKVAARAARLVPKAFMLAQSAGIVLDPEVLKSALKFTKPSEYKNISSKDLENLKYLFHAVTGGANIAKSHYRAKQYRENINKQLVLTKEGTAKLSNKLVKDINKAGRKGGQKAAEEKFKEYAKAEAAEGLFKFSENGLSRFNPARYSSKIAKVASSDLQLKGTQTTDLRALSNTLKEDANRPWYHFNKGYAKQELTPFRKTTPIKLENSKQTTSKPKTLESSQVVEQKQLENKSNTLREQLFNKATMNRYKEHLKGKFSNKTILEGTQKIGDTDMNVSSTVNLRNGKITYDIHFGKKHFYNLTLEKAKLKVFNLVKENRKTVDKQSEKVNKKSTAEIGKILLNLKKKGWLKLGGTINPSLDIIIEDFFKHNNI